MRLNDKVRFLNEALKGTITRIIDDKMVAVEIEDGFEIPVLKSEIVLDGQPTASGNKVSAPAINTGKPAGMYIVLEQRFNTFYYQKVFNYFDVDASMVCYQKKEQGWEFKSHAVLKPATGILIDNVDFTETNQWPEIFISVSLHRDMQADVPEPFLYMFKYRAKDYTHVEKNAEGKMIYSVKQEAYRAKVNIDVERNIVPIIQPTIKPEYIEMERPSSIVDLHIERLHSNPTNISAEEALQLQLNTFENNYEKALSLNYGKITFIHGIGNGSLKNHIWGVLSKSKDIRNYKEAMKEKFGYGATEVVFK